MYLIYDFMAMTMQFTTSSSFLVDIPVAIISKRDVIRHKMRRYKDVKVYLYSFILPEYMSDEYVAKQLDEFASQLYFRISFFP